MRYPASLDEPSCFNGKCMTFFWAEMLVVAKLLKKAGLGDDWDFAASTSAACRCVLWSASGSKRSSNMFKYSLMISLMLTIVSLYFLSTGAPWWFWCSCIGFFPQHATGCRFGLLGILPLSLTARIEDQRRKAVYHGFLNWQIWDRWFIIIYHWFS